MLSSIGQRNYFYKHHQEIKRLLNAFSIVRSLEDLHRLRVEIKKNRALFHLWKHCDVTIDYSQYANIIKSIFISAGKIRYNQVTLQLLQHLKSGENQDTLSDEVINKDIVKLVAESGKLTAQLDVAAEPIRLKFKNISTHNIMHYYDIQFNKVTKVFSSKSSQKAWHKTRKRIKRLIYLHDLIPVAANDKLKLDVEYLRKLEDCIGKWHDLATLSLPSMNGLKINEAEKEKLKGQMKQQKNKILKLGRSLAKV